MSDQFEQKPLVSEKEISVKIWGGVTDPKEHDPKNFRYLIHAFNPLASRSQGLIVASAISSGRYKLDESQGDQAINLFDQPERLGERVSLSMSLIDQEHIKTWGKGGLIVEAPEGNIVITSATDSGSHNSSKEFLKKQALSKPVLSGDELLKNSHSEDFNEVVAFAKSDTGETLRLKGFFIKVDKHGQPIDSVVARKMKEHAERLNLPLVEIQVQGPYEQEMLKIAENSVWAQYKGNGYNLGSDNPDFAFSMYDGKVNTFFPSPQEIEDVIIHFVERGDLDQAQAQQIRERYKIVDAKRKSPKIEHDPKTKEMNKVTIEDGYGKDEVEYWLLPSGYCFKVNMERFSEALTETSLNPRRSRDAFEFLRYQTPLSGSEALSILESRRETMQQEEYEKLLSLFNGIKDKIDSVCRQLTSEGRGQNIIIRNCM